MVAYSLAKASRKCVTGARYCFFMRVIFSAPYLPIHFWQATIGQVWKLGYFRQRDGLC